MSEKINGEPASSEFYPRDFISDNVFKKEDLWWGELEKLSQQELNALLDELKFLDDEKSRALKRSEIREQLPFPPESETGDVQADEHIDKLERLYNLAKKVVSKPLG